MTILAIGEDPFDVTVASTPGWRFPAAFRRQAR